MIVFYSCDEFRTGRPPRPLKRTNPVARVRENIRNDRRLTIKGAAEDSRKRNNLDTIVYLNTLE